MLGARTWGFQGQSWWVKGMEAVREVMDIRAASDYLGISSKTLYRFAYPEKIPAFKLGHC